ncbi:MAG: hypothetical protein NTY01_10120 [Verrucomicrobia bacterium]|nr:hypothetical protein [Verrucomicrobiota bacterium]
MNWIVEVEGLRPYTHNGWEYDFLTEGGRITHITVAVPIGPSDTLPRLKPNAADQNTIDFDCAFPSCSEFLFKTLRTLEGFLAVFSLERIAIEDTDVTWVPESEEDKRRLTVTHFNFKFKKADRASTARQDLEVPLGFFRKGRNDFLERRYIDAIYDFYFVLETLFGNGKWRNYQVKAEFKKSPELIKFAQQVLSEGEQSLIRRQGRRSLLDAFRKKYSGKTPEEFLDSIVDLRGCLHHHNLAQKSPWNPALEYEYELDAHLMSDLCFKICESNVMAILWPPA